MIAKAVENTVMVIADFALIYVLIRRFKTILFRGLHLLQVDNRNLYE